jgi:hypothetical protein
MGVIGSLVAHYASELTILAYSLRCKGEDPWPPGRQSFFAEMPLFQQLRFPQTQIAGKLPHCRTVQSGIKSDFSRNF